MCKNKENRRSVGTETPKHKTQNPHTAACCRLYTAPPMRIRDLLQNAAPCAPDSPCTLGAPCAPGLAAPRALGLAAAVNAFHHAPARRTRPALDLPFFGATFAAREALCPAPMCVLLHQRTLQSATHLALYTPALGRLLADPEAGAPEGPAPALAPAPERGRPPSARELRKLQKRAYDRAYSRAARAARAARGARGARARGPAPDARPKENHQRRPCSDGQRAPARED